MTLAHPGESLEPQKRIPVLNRHPECREDKLADGAMSFGCFGTAQRGAMGAPVAGRRPARGCFALSPPLNRSGGRRPACRTRSA